MSCKHVLLLPLLLLLLLGGCATAPPQTKNWTARPNLFEVGCQSPPLKVVFASPKPTRHDKQHWRVVKPCLELIVRSRHRTSPSNGNKPGSVPASQTFTQIASGHVSNWTWEISETPEMARVPAVNANSGGKATTTSRHLYAGQSQNRWPLLFRHLFDVYRYVLAENPPTSIFSINFFPSRLSLDKSVTDSAVNSITLPLFFPYKTQSNKDYKLKYFANRTAIVPCFEYMHTIFYTKRLKVPNYLGSSVAGWITCSALQLLSLQHSGASLHLPSAQQSRIHLGDNASQWLLHHGAVDAYGSILANENIALALGCEKRKCKIEASDKSAILRLLKLARAMLQQPVDFTKQELYPLKRLASVPSYTGTSADISANP